MKNFLVAARLRLLTLVRKPIVTKALHTFWQGFLGTLLAGIPLVTTALHDHGMSALWQVSVSLLTASVMAGLSMVKTATLSYLRK